VKVLSNASIYGLRALIYVASQKNDSAYVGIKEISDNLDISFHFLTKILQTLSQNNILSSYRGPNGGVALTRPPEQIFLVEVVKVLEGQDFFDTCMLGLPGCGEVAPCPMHHFWKDIKAVFLHEFETTSLADLGAKIKARSMRL